MAKSGQIKEALAIARDITDEYGNKSQALVLIAESMAKSGQIAEAKKILAEALAIARDIADGHGKSQALAFIAESMAKSGQIKEALAIARDITDGNLKSQALALIAESMAKSGQSRLINVVANQKDIFDEEYKKFSLWNAEKMPYQEKIVTEYFASSDPQGFLFYLKQSALKLVSRGFDYNNEKELWLAFVGIMMSGIYISFEEFKERINGLKKFDYAYPGYFKKLFTKAGSLKAMEISAKETRALNTVEVNLSVLKENLETLLRIKEKIDSLNWFKSLASIKAFSLSNIYYQFKYLQVQENGRIKKGEIFRVEFPNENAMSGEIKTNLKLFTRLCLSWPLISGLAIKLWRMSCLNYCEI